MYSCTEASSHGQEKTKNSFGFALLKTIDSLPYWICLLIGRNVASKRFQRYMSFFVPRIRLSMTEISNYLTFFISWKKVSNNFYDSTIADVICVEQPSCEATPPRNNTRGVLKSTGLSGAPAREIFTLWSVLCPEPQIITNNSEANDLTIPLGYRGRIL